MTRRDWLRRDELGEVDRFYASPSRFAPAAAPGSTVTPAFASPFEGRGAGKVVTVNADRTEALVEWDASGERSTVEPWDVYLDEENR